MPPVTNPGAPGEPTQTGANPNPAAQALGKDSLGREFDPVRFRPKKDILGRWINLRSGPGRPGANPKSSGDPRKANPNPENNAGGANPPPPADPAASVIPPDEPMPEKPALPPGEDCFTIAAHGYLFAGYSILDGIHAGHGEWMPDDAAEHEGMKQAIAAWLRSRQSDDLPPGAAFAVAAIAYAVKRHQRPNTQIRWRIWWLYLRAWWGNRSARAKLEEIQAASAPQAGGTP